MAGTQYCPGIRGYSSPFNYRSPHTKELENLWPLGPIGDRRHGIQGLKFKKESAKRVLHSVLNRSGSGSLTDLIRDISWSVEPGLRAAYTDATLGNLCDHKKLEQLVADTCFFLLLAFSILGAKLEFPDQHEYFGVGRVKQDMEKWLRSIFYVGNQIPFILVDKLVDSLSYLKLIRDEIRRKKPPSEFLERALFEFVVYDPSRLSPPVDVVHCLRSIIVGPEPETLSIWIDGEKDAQGTASALYEDGRVFKPLPREAGCREIKCERHLMTSTVYLPYMEVVSETSLELMVTTLDHYETAHGEFEPESKCYFSLLSHLIRSPDDVQVLHSHGIIAGVNLGCLIRVLESFYRIPQIAPDIQRREIQGNRPRLYLFWEYKFYITGLLVIIHLLWGLISGTIQSVFTVAGYYKHK